VVCGWVDPGRRLSVQLAQRPCLIERVTERLAQTGDGIVVRLIRRGVLRGIIQHEAKALSRQTLLNHVQDVRRGEVVEPDRQRRVRP
jgi:hypothetical protein